MVHTTTLPVSWLVSWLASGSSQTNSPSQLPLNHPLAPINCSTSINSATSVSFNQGYVYQSVPFVTDTLQDTVFWVQSIEGSRIRMCYGCQNSIRKDTMTLPLPPYDFVVGHKERRMYRDPNTHQLTLTPKPENVYFHMSRKCIEMKHPYFNDSMLYISPSIIPCLTPLLICVVNLE